MSTKLLLQTLIVGVVITVLIGVSFSSESRVAARNLKLSISRMANLIAADKYSQDARLVTVPSGPTSGVASPTAPNTNKEVAALGSNSKPQDEQLGPDAALATVRPRRIGIFVSDSPIDSSSLVRLNGYSSLGVDTILNYSILDGTPAEIKQYLDRAQSLGVKVIFSLKDLYDQLGPNNYRSLYTYPIGTSNQSAAINAVRQFGSHPAVWGFAINDERPESPADLLAWQGTMNLRYNLIKQNTTKPVMMVLVGATSSSGIVRAQFLRSLRSSTDTFALDYYPIPFQPSTFIRNIGRDFVAANDNDGWFVEQVFSWSSYPDTARGLGFDLSSARYPSPAEMLSMARMALNNGAHNILFYSYFDIANNPSQISALRQTIKALRN